jgi:hypothetical protein
MPNGETWSFSLAGTVNSAKFAALFTAATRFLRDAQRVGKALAKADIANVVEFPATVK